jgi:hypothetical protein
MRIAIPVADLGKGKNIIAGTLSAIGQLCLYDVEARDCLWLKVSELAPNLGELLPALESRSVTDIISAKMQPMALKVLVNRGFQVYQSHGSDLNENIRLHAQNGLCRFDMQELLADAQLCGGACDSCDTTCETPTAETTLEASVKQFIQINR